MLTVFGLPVEDLVVGDGDLPRDPVQLEAGGHLLVPAHPGVDHGAAVTVSGQHLHTRGRVRELVISRNTSSMTLSIDSLLTNLFYNCHNVTHAIAPSMRLTHTSSTSQDTNIIELNQGHY